MINIRQNEKALISKEAQIPNDRYRGCLSITLHQREKYAQLFICDLKLMCIGENEINPQDNDNRLLQSIG